MSSAAGCLHSSLVYKLLSAPWRSAPRMFCGHFTSVRASGCCRPDSPSGGCLLQCPAVSVVCTLPNRIGNVQLRQLKVLGLIARVQFPSGTASTCV